MTKYKKNNQKYTTFLNDKLWRSFFIVWSLRNFAFGLVAVFSPIYFYSNGYGLGFIFILLAIQAFFNGLMRLPYARLLSKNKNIKKPFAVGIVLMSLVYGAYAVFIDNKNALFVIAAIDGVIQCMLWSSYHYIFSASQHHKRIGSQVGIMYDGSFVAMVAAIFAGGLIGQKFGLIYNFIIASVLLIVTAIIILNTKINWPHNPHNFKRHKVNFKFIYRDSLAGIANIIDANVVSIIWPLLFVVFSLLNYAQVGFIIALGLVLTSIVNIFFGNKANDIDEAKNQLNIGILATMFLYFIRILSITSSIGAIFMNIAGQILRGSVDVSFSTLFYRRLKHAESKIRYIAEFESYAGYGLALFFVTLWAIQITGESEKLTMVCAFLIAALLMPITKLISNK